MGSESEDSDEIVRMRIKGNDEGPIRLTFAVRTMEVEGWVAKVRIMMGW